MTPTGWLITALLMVGNVLDGARLQVRSGIPEGSRGKRHHLKGRLNVQVLTHSHTLPLDPGLGTIEKMVDNVSLRQKTRHH